MEQVFARVRDAHQEAVPYLQLPYGILRPELVDRCSSGPLLEITLNHIPDMRAVSAVRQQDIVVDNRFLSADDARMEQSAGRTPLRQIHGRRSRRTDLVAALP